MAKVWYAGRCFNRGHPMTRIEPSGFHLLGEVTHRALHYHDLDFVAVYLPRVSAFKGNIKRVLFAPLTTLDLRLKVKYARKKWGIAPSNLAKK